MYDSVYKHAVFYSFPDPPNDRQDAGFLISQAFTRLFFLFSVSLFFQFVISRQLSSLSEWKYPLIIYATKERHKYSPAQRALHVYVIIHKTRNKRQVYILLCIAIAITITSELFIL